MKVMVEQLRQFDEYNRFEKANKNSSNCLKWGIVFKF